MMMQFHPEIIQLNVDQEELVRWKRGEREDCSDAYLRKVGLTQKNSSGFGEYIAGKYFESKGYQYIHRFGILGGNKLGTFEVADDIFKQLLGEKNFLNSFNFKKMFPTLKIELPDILFYNLDTKEFGFAEVKRMDTKDKVRDAQLKGLALLNILFDAPVYIVEVSIKK